MPPRAKKTRLWVSARKTTQIITLLAIIGLLVMARSGNLSSSLVSLPLRLDPLVMVSYLLSSRVFLISTSLALFTVLLTLVFGRAWCGWLCPLGTLLDIVPLKSKNQQSIPSSWRSFKYFLLLTTLVAALLGNLTLLALDPLTIFIRSVSASLWPLIDRAITLVEVNLYPVPGLTSAVSVFDEAMRPAILPLEPEVYRSTILYLTIFLGVIFLNLAAPRFWCRYLCPLGALLGLLSKLSLFRLKVADDCKGCGLCVKVCPTGTIDQQRGYASDPAECIMCLDCLPGCPRNSIAFTPTARPAPWYDYDPNRRQALLSIGAAVAGIAILSGGKPVQEEQPYLLHPPGVQADEFLGKCIRCAVCIRVCPTSGLQPSLAEARLEGLWTPVLIPRLGYCAYSCSACGQVCPVEAIPPLELEEKRQQVIGKASIDRDRCIAWAEGQDCIVCEEMCPVPEKAIYLEHNEYTKADGSLGENQVPHVQTERCIGCGICEFKCPVSGNAAIRVYSSPD